MANQRIDGEEQEALFHSYPCAVYYVQSPSTVSHANSSDCRNNEYVFQSPFPSENFITNPTNTNQEVSRFMLSRYSSSRGSNNSFLHEKKIVYDLRGGKGTENDEKHQVCGDDDMEDDIDLDLDVHDDDEDDDEEDGRRKGCWRFFSFGTSPSCMWISLQISWRLMVSLGAALLVFFLATRPPPPKMFIKMGGIREFGLGEGVDGSGVTTKILTSNCSMDLEVDNKSKLFRLHIRPSTIQMSFGRLVFATSQSPELYAESNSLTTFQVYVGTRNKAMYGAGRSMVDMLDSGKGLPLMIRMSFSSYFHVVWNLIKPTFHHHAECLLVLDGAHGKLHGTHAYNSSCRITSGS